VALPSFRLFSTKLASKSQSKIYYGPPNLRYTKNRWWSLMETKTRCTRIRCCACLLLSKSTIKAILLTSCLRSLQRRNLYFLKVAMMGSMGVRNVDGNATCCASASRSSARRWHSSHRLKGKIVMRDVAVFAVQKHCIRILMIGVKNNESRAECCALARNISGLI